MRGLQSALSIPAVLTLVATACQPAVDYAAEEQAIRDLDAEWVAAVAAADWAKCASFYAPDGYFLPANAEPLVGPEAIEQGWATMEGFDLTFEPVRIVIAQAGDMAWDYGTYHLSAEGMEDNGKYVVVWQQLDGEWKAVADIFNSSVAAGM